MGVIRFGVPQQLVLWLRDRLGADAFVAIAHGLQEAWAKRFATMGDSAKIAPLGSTTHLSVVDRDGNMVTLTQTLLSLFGSQFLSPQTGILLNNAINWFDPRPGGPNAMAMSLGPVKCSIHGSNAMLTSSAGSARFPTITG